MSNGKNSPSSVAPSFTIREILSAWGRVLRGRLPLLSIEITRECPLACPGCYAYGDAHLGGGVTLRQLNDLRGDALVEGVLALVRKHRPLHVSLVGGEPLVRQRELCRILPEMGKMGVFTLVVTSGVTPIPLEWTRIPRVRVAVSVDGLPEHHDARRAPATYARILQNITGREVNIHWVITAPMMRREGYLEEYVAFWSARPEVNRIWVSLYTPQMGENSREMLRPQDRALAARALPALYARYPKLLLPEGVAQAFLAPPRSPGECLFARMSANYSADLATRVEPCVFGGTPDCAQCGCAISGGLHWIRTIRVAGPLRIEHFISSSMAVGMAVDRLASRASLLSRWRGGATPTPRAGSGPDAGTNLVQLRP